MKTTKIEWTEATWNPLIDNVGALNLENIHWVIVGGESGVCARPMNREMVVFCDRYY